MFVHHKPNWALNENLATDEAAFLNRRKFMKAAGIGALGLGLSGLIGCEDPASAEAKGAVGKAGGFVDPTADLYPAPRNAAFTLQRPVTDYAYSSVYNNFYEFGSHKKISNAAQALQTRPWTVEVGGEVGVAKTWDIDSLIRAMPLEERLYRHRCVEAWAMAVPWTGFPLAALLAKSEPTAKARYVRMETFLDPKVATGQKQYWYPWPYVEGLSIEEAMNDLAFMATGVYGKPLAKQFGAPLRLAVPWKYGFKSIKSITRITLTQERPVSFWEGIDSNEYGFWANVNPEVPHARWSQASERLLGSGDRVATQLYNGYGEQVASLYAGMANDKIFF